MVIGVLLGGIVIAKIGAKTFGGDKMARTAKKFLIRLSMARMNMIKIDIKMLKARRQRAMMAIKAMDSARNKVPSNLRKMITMQINNIKSNVRAANGLINSLMRERSFLKTRIKRLK